MTLAIASGSEFVVSDAVAGIKVSSTGLGAQLIQIILTKPHQGCIQKFPEWASGAVLVRIAHKGKSRHIVERLEPEFLQQFPQRTQLKKPRAITTYSYRLEFIPKAKTKKPVDAKLYAELSQAEVHAIRVAIATWRPKSLWTSTQTTILDSLQKRAKKFLRLRAMK